MYCRYWLLKPLRNKALIQHRQSGIALVVSTIDFGHSYVRFILPLYTNVLVTTLHDTYYCADA